MTQGIPELLSALEAKLTELGSEMTCLQEYINSLEDRLVSVNAELVNVILERDNARKQRDDAEKERHETLDKLTAAEAREQEMLRNVQSADAERKQWDFNYRTYCQTIADLEQRLAAAEDAFTYAIHCGGRLADMAVNGANIPQLRAFVLAEIAKDGMREWLDGCREAERAAKGGRDE